jgi:2-polyprenyl-3-methyl-5-hydroxy-6-metoxy-1,4-benzoquinol methylase
MHINVNTRLRWETIKNLPTLKALQGKRVMDLGAGLGYFSVRFSELGARVLAVDVDQKALDYLSRQFGMEVRCMDVANDPMPDEKFDLIFIGEILEHIKEPFDLLQRAKCVLAPGGVILVTTPAMEGILTNTEGKRLGHHEGAEAHERDGFYIDELKAFFDRLEMKTVYHAFTIYTFAEIFMQLTKVGYLRKKSSYRGQSDVINVTSTFPFKVLKFIFPVLVLLFKAEQTVSGKLKLKGHCHVVVAQI